MNFEQFKLKTQQSKDKIQQIAASFNHSKFVLIQNNWKHLFET